VLRSHARFVMVERMATTKGADLLILAAHAPELVGFRTALGSNLAGAIQNLRIVCATVGVGMPAAGAGAMRHVRDARPRAVLLLGSCGLYPRQVEFRPLVPLIPKGIRLVDASVLNQKAAFPAPMQLLVEPDAALSDAIAEVDPLALRGELATTLTITTDDALAVRIGRKTACCGENLEAFAVALACAARDLPFAALLVSTNAVGSKGREQWAKHQRKAAERGARLLLDWIARGAHGLPTRR
jgi:nucleoside phosphorylase